MMVKKKKKNHTGKRRQIFSDMPLKLSVKVCINNKTCAFGFNAVINTGRPVSGRRLVLLGSCAAEELLGTYCWGIK